MKKSSNTGNKLVLEVIRVRVESGKVSTNERDLPALQKIQTAGFTQVTCPRHAAEGQKNTLGVILLEIDMSNPGNQKSCRLIGEMGGVYHLIEEGKTPFTPLPNQLNIDFKGTMSWETHCKPATSKMCEGLMMAIRRGEISENSSPPPPEPKLTSEALRLIAEAEARKAAEQVVSTPPQVETTITPQAESTPEESKDSPPEEEAVQETAPVPRIRPQRKTSRGPETAVEVRLKNFADDLRLLDGLTDAELLKFAQSSNGAFGRYLHVLDQAPNTLRELRHRFVLAKAVA